MSAEFYKILHFVSIFFFLGSVAMSFTSTPPTKVQKIVTGVSSLLILVAGMGLIAKELSLSHGEGWPMWIKAKIVLWLVMAAGAAIMVKRVKVGREMAGYGLIAVASLTAYVAVYKPF